MILNKLIPFMFAFGLCDAYGAVGGEISSGDGVNSEKTESIITGSSAIVPEVAQVSLNTLSSQERTEGWIPLFDGKTVRGWRGYRKDHLPLAWVVEDGTLHLPASNRLTRAQREDRGDIVFDRVFENFILRLDWKLSPGGNSGIFYLGREDPQFDFIWQTAPEMQILDNEGHPDASRGVAGNRQAGSLYDLVPAQPQNAKPIGEWNQVEITVNNRRVIHKQNGQVVVAYQLDTPAWVERVATSKFPALNANWGHVAKSGLIGLQDHGDGVWFRNLRIKVL